MGMAGKMASPPGPTQQRGKRGGRERRRGGVSAAVTGTGEEASGLAGVGYAGGIDPR